MNKTAIKNFAIWARVQLMEAAKQRAFEYGITEGGENKPDVDVIAGRLLSSQEIKLRNQLIVRIQQKGFTQVMEEAAYTWFNRLIAIRFMEVNGYLLLKPVCLRREKPRFRGKSQSGLVCRFSRGWINGSCPLLDARKRRTQGTPHYPVTPSAPPALMFENRKLTERFSCQSPTRQ